MVPARISRRAFMVSALAAAVAAPSVRAQPRLEKIRLTLGVTARAQMQYLPLAMADALGYFRAEGLDLEFNETPGAAADVYCGGFEQVLALQARGQWHQCLALQARTPALALGVSTRAFPLYGGWAELRGRRIGIEPAPLSNLVAQMALARGGLKPEDVSFVPVAGGLAAAAALRAGTVDALCHADPAMTSLEQRAEVRIVSDTRTLKGTQAVFGGPMPAACLHAPQEFVQKHPATCQALVHALVHALKWLQTAGPRDILRTVPEAWLLGDRALYLAAFEKQRESISPDGRVSTEAALTAVRALGQVDGAVRSERIDITRSYTNEFAQRAKERFHA